jgi:hypothetical protein
MAFRHTLGYYLISAEIAATGGADAIWLVSDLICVTAIFSEITVASGANACSWQFDPTTGTAAQAMCVAGDINLALVGDFVSITELAGVRTLTTGALISTITPSRFILPAGTISFVSAAADGSLIHKICYLPITSGAVVTASP